MKALLVAGASVAFGVNMACYGYTGATSDQCTAANNCTTYTASCYRLGTTGAQNTSACPTTAMTCAAGTTCTPGTKITDTKTCSKCTDACSAQTTNQTCEGDNWANCRWAPAGCKPAPTPSTYVVPCIANTLKTTCLTEAGCNWVSLSLTICGASNAQAICAPCNFTFTPAIRSALKNKIGQTCTWPAMAPYTQAASLTITDVAQSSDLANCPAYAAASADDVATLTAAGKGGSFGGSSMLPFDGAVGTCMQAAGAASLIPSLAILGLIAAVVA